MRSVKDILLVLAALTFLAGCAGPVAQSVTLSPMANAQSGDVGHSRALAFKVEDARTDRAVLGYRDMDGGRTAPISLSGDLAAVVGEAAMRPLTDMGFTPKAFREGAPLSLVVTVRELQYSAKRSGMTKKVAVRCVLDARVVNGAGGWQGSFPVSREKEVMATPGVNDNAAFLNSVLTDSLNMMFSDQEFVQYLGREPIQPKKASNKKK